MSRHTLWRFLARRPPRGAVPSAVLNSVGGDVAALEAATLEIIIDLEGLRPDPALRPLRESLEEALLLLLRHSPGHRGRPVTLWARSGV